MMDMKRAEILICSSNVLSDLLAGAVGTDETLVVVVTVNGVQLADVEIVIGLQLVAVGIVVVLELVDGQTVGHERQLVGVTVVGLQLEDEQAVGYEGHDVGVTVLREQD
jgi:hypothetical protein